MLNTVRIIVLPLLVGLSMGLVAGLVALFGVRLLLLNFSHKQEIATFFGFVLLGAIFGFIDTANRFVEWIRFRKEKRK